MRVKATLIIFLLFININYSQTVKYSTSWFGPNAAPVPEFTDGRIPDFTTINLMGDYYFGFGDETKNINVRVEVPLLPKKISIKVWNTFLEYYRVTEEVSRNRDMLNGNRSGLANGDFYVQTRISILKEKKKSPAIVLNSTLKTTSGTGFKNRRYFDTPGYYFDVEIAKSYNTNSKFINEIRAVANLGFLTYETVGSLQNDASLYGTKLIIGNPIWKFENTLSGYWGWMHSYHKFDSDYGDTPVVYASKFNIHNNSKIYFLQYQYGIKDFPYHQIRLGISFPIENLTPNFIGKN